MTIDIIAIVNGNVLLLVSGLPSLAWVTALPSSSSLPPFIMKDQDKTKLIVVHGSTLRAGICHSS